MPATGKAELRRQLRATRDSVSDSVRADEDRALAQHLAAALTTGSLVTGDTVCTYVPTDAEPGSIAMLDDLLQRAGRVLAPVARTDADGEPLALRWGEYRPGQLVTGGFGLLEPPEPWLPPTALAEARLVLLPALAVDRHGVRLGRGAGFYDRSLGYRDPAAQLVAVVRDEELVDTLPAESHDVRMTHALTPGRGLVALGTTPD